MRCCPGTKMVTMPSLMLPDEITSCTAEVMSIMSALPFESKVSVFVNTAMV